VLQHALQGTGVARAAERSNLLIWSSQRQYTCACSEWHRTSPELGARKYVCDRTSRSQHTYLHGIEAQHRLRCNQISMPDHLCARHPSCVVEIAHSAPETDLSMDANQTKSNQLITAEHCHHA